MCILLQIEGYASSEVDEDSIKVTKVHHPEVVHLGDIQNLSPKQVR